MKFRSKFNHGFTIHGYLHCAILKPLHGCNVTRAHVAIDFSISLSKCQKWDFSDLQNVSEEPVELTQKLATKKTASNSWYFYVATTVSHYYTVTMEVIVLWLWLFNAIELYILKSLKVYRSNTACCSSMQLIFQK